MDFALGPKYANQFVLKVNMWNEISLSMCILIFNMTKYVFLPLFSYEHIILASNKAGTIAGAIIGTLLALAIICLIVFCCRKKHREKKYEKEVHHDIR